MPDPNAAPLIDAPGRVAPPVKPLEGKRRGGVTWRDRGPRAQDLIYGSRGVFAFDSRGRLSHLWPGRPRLGTNLLGSVTDQGCQGRDLMGVSPALAGG